MINRLIITEEPGRPTTVAGMPGRHGGRFHLVPNQAAAILAELKTRPINLDD
jgi:hypothetical protein